MVSRRKILSRSRDDLHMEAPPDEEDVWYQKEKLFKVQPNKGHIDCYPLRVICLALQVLRDEIGTAMTNIKSRTDHTYMVRKGRGRRRSDPSRKRVQMYV